MYSNLDDFLENDKSVEEKKDMVNEMIGILDVDQLSQVIEFLSGPFFANKLKDYLLDFSLPDIESKEFLFLIQAEKYNGNIVRKMMNEVGISNYYLNKFIHKYKLQEVSSGIYIFPHKNIDAPFLFQSQYSKAVISHESALYMLDLSDVIPKRTIVSLPKDYKFSQLERNSNDYIKIYNGVYNNNKALVLSYYENDPIFVTKNNPIGSTQIVLKKSMKNNLVRVTSAERTIADILAPKSNIEEEVKHEALRRYYDLYHRDSNRLRRIAHKQGVLKELDKYLWELQL
ncbi:type IV toxin-antitoxin system AbiEi family antitoxin domain-containing protein [Enterococcus sp. DIV2381]|uniref:type IV toxin-antitoxin system AbiEi family antitoxin domain-containing protein n=1 Tax=unclassified Enterococcus TaxID=2608891 RepID=UPI003D298D76